MHVTLYNTCENFITVAYYYLDCLFSTTNKTFFLEHIFILETTCSPDISPPNFYLEVCERKVILK